MVQAFVGSSPTLRTSQQPSDLVLKRNVRGQHKRAIKKEVELVLYNNICSSKKHKKTLEGVGIATVRIDFNESERDQFYQKVPELFER